MSGNKTYLITGGEGFVGFHLCRELTARGAERIVTYDARKHWVPDAESRWTECHSHRIDQLDTDGRVTRVHGDTTDRTRLQETIECYEPDAVIHLAALPIATVCSDRPGAARRNILEGTLSVLDATLDAGIDVDRVTYVSSSMVYGDFETSEGGDVQPATEEQDCDPKGIYGSLKLAGERLVRTYGRQFDLPYTIVRPSAVYGPTDCNRRVTEIFLRRSLRGERLRLDNGGYHQLDFTYVTDLAAGLALATTHEGASSETFNVTRGEGRSIRELASVIGQYTGGVQTYTEERDRTRPRRGALDISKARDILGYEPSYSLEDGIAAWTEFVDRHDTMECTSAEDRGVNTVRSNE